MLASTGIGFQSVTALCPATLESAMLTACTVTEFGLGTAAGAVYKPDALILPVALAPPTTPFTCHVTDMFDEPVAANGCAVPARSVAVLGETETFTAGGGEGGGAPGFPEDSPTVPVHAAWNMTESKRRIGRIRRMMGPLL